MKSHGSGTVAQIAARLETEAAARLRLRLCFGGHRIDVVSNSRELVEILREYYSAFDEGDHARAADLVVRAHQMTPPDFALDFVEWKREPGKQGRKEAYFEFPDGRVVLKVRTGMQFLIGDNLRVACGDCLANPNQIVNFINFQYTAHLMNRGRVLCHAAGIVGGQEKPRGLGLAAVSGGGKSTLALHLMSAGLSFTSNDRLLVGLGSDGIEMTGVPKHPRINPGTILGNPDLSAMIGADHRRAFERMPREELWELEEKYDARIDWLYGSDRIELHAPMEAFVVLTWSHRSADATRFEAVDLARRPDLLDAITKSPGPFFRPDAGLAPTGFVVPDPEPYLKIFAGLPVYEGSGTADFGAGVAFCQDLLSRSR
jgi:HprK-related kinase B